tara:strand:- start:901 stop:1464 length:564 start_codon:yes stop_codon:yes gene_type:complete
MRIISGFLKGKRIKYTKNIITRPLRDSVKENIFNILRHSNSIKIKIEKANVLDLYSGVGSFGIECISRGAENVTFIENNKDTSNILKENLLNLSILSKTEVYNSKIDEVLSKKNFNNQFNVFFLDPPFKDNFFLKNLKLIKKKKLFEIENIVIIHREKKTSDNLNNLIKVIETKVYGRSKIIFGFLT